MRRFYSTMVTMLLFTVYRIAFAAATGSTSGSDLLTVSPLTNTQSDDIKVFLDLGNNKVFDSEVYAQAVVYMDELKTAPSCQRLAVKTLIGACESVESSNFMENELSEVREEFAARIATCELKATARSVKNAIPSECAKLLPSTDACPHFRSGGAFNRWKPFKDAKSKELCYYKLSRPQVSSCVTGLYSVPQSWTSYSNALQNIHAICQVARNSIERGTFCLKHAN